MKNLTTSIYTFEDLIGGNYLYVDKPEKLWQLLSRPKAFISFPARGVSVSRLLCPR